MNLTGLYAGPVLRLGPGLGRDFVVGDVHGCFDLLEQALAVVAFNPEKDRLILLGDLVDRGPYSKECLDVLSQPWCYCVRGNHEDLLVSYYLNGWFDDLAFLRDMPANGTEWWFNLDEQTRIPYLRAFAQLPIALELQTSQGLVGFVHAEVPIGMAWQPFLECLERGDSRVTFQALWGRTRYAHDNCSGVRGVPHLFAGHTIHHEGVTHYGNMSIIDTGASRGRMGLDNRGHLTIVDVLSSPEDYNLGRRVGLVNAIEPRASGR